MIKYLTLIIFILLLSCKNSTPPPSAPVIQTISSGQAHNFILQQIENPSFIIVDVRTNQEFESGHITNAINIDWLDQSNHQKLLSYPKTHTILIYCQSGRRSLSAAQFLNTNGYKSVFNIYGGIINWNQTIQSLTPDPKNEINYQ